jgi:hypothetical protein
VAGQQSSENPLILCEAKTRQAGRPCSRPAGWGTDHPGGGRCKLHGGASSGRPVTHGRYSLKHRKSLLGKVDRLLSDPTPGDLSQELALTRALLQDYLDRLPQERELSTGEISVCQSLLREIRTIVDTMNRIYERSSLTAAEVQYLKARIADLAVKYVPDDMKRAAFFVELEAAVGGGTVRGGPA